MSRRVRRTTSHMVPRLSSAEIDEAANLLELAGRSMQQRKFAAAVECFNKVLDIDPGYGAARADLMYALQHACLWDELKVQRREVEKLTRESLRKGVKTDESPFMNVLRCDDPRRNLAVAQSWSRDIAIRMSRYRATLPRMHDHTDRSTITVGYLSSDFYDHPIAHLTSSLFSLHDRESFRIHAYSYGPDNQSHYRARIMKDCDKFVDLRELDDVNAARRIREDQVDILVDLNGHTRGARLDIAALRPAPVQVTYLGFPGTVGAEFFDYIITDRIVTPPDHARYYTEEFVYLPHCYQVNDGDQPISENSISRSDYGLPEDGFVFCSLNETTKIEPVMFGAWMELLREIDESVIWLMQGTDLVERNLLREAEKRGVGASRLVFAERLPKSEHLARLGLADLYLDTRVYNGHTTISDALWAGVPGVTLQGAHFASRVGSSILSAIGLPELITHSLAEYKQLAARLARDSNDLRAIKQKISKNRVSEPLFDSRRFVKNLEDGYAQMWKAFLAGDKPHQIEADAHRDSA